MKIELDLPIPDGWRYREGTFDMIKSEDTFKVFKGVVTFERIEVIPCTDKAKTSIEGVAVWKK